MLEAIISSTPKNRKYYLNCSERCRGIVLCSALCKFFDSIIIKRYYDQLMSNDLQFSYKAKHSTIICTATLKEIASHYAAKCSQVFMCILDATKAFDKVDFVKLFELLMRRDIPGVFLRLILDLYTRQTLKTEWNGSISGGWGGGGGGVLSLILFNVYFDELLQRLQDIDIGCHVGTKSLGYLSQKRWHFSKNTRSCVNAVARAQLTFQMSTLLKKYFDDLTLLSPLWRLQKTVDICDDFAQEYSVKFNSKKTQCMCIGKFKGILNNPDVASKLLCTLLFFLWFPAVVPF